MLRRRGRSMSFLSRSYLWPEHFTEVEQRAFVRAVDDRAVADLRFWLGFALLFAVLFGSLQVYRAQRVLGLPACVVAFLAANVIGWVLAFRWWSRVWTSHATRELARIGLCTRCGYDCRSVAGRCPECGAAPPPPR